jgi:hypothetical protein
MLHQQHVAWPFEKVVNSNGTSYLKQSKREMSAVVTVAVRWRQDARSHLGLPPFLAPPFA